MTQRNKGIIKWTAAAAGITAYAFIVLLMAGFFTEGTKLEAGAPVYDSAEQAVEAHVEEDDIRKSTAWMQTPGGEHLMVSEVREHAFRMGKVKESEGKFQPAVLFSSISLLAANGSLLKGTASAEISREGSSSGAYTLQIGMDQPHKLPDSKFEFDVLDEEGTSLVESVQFVDGTRQ
ncbi:hypothetical protein [Salibacterium lacus]|uniref:Uncharacterized protein n=1 Tax=Salibacterium lacus TaxID=1898109 RepID=A0ABW5T3S1_9BACI